MVQCSLIIRAFNEAQHIERLLVGITQQTIKDIDIILVDSGSTDDTIAIASKYPLKIVKIKPEEFTFGRSLNRGIAEAHGEFIVIASAHVYPIYPDWLEKLLAPFSDSKIALTYGKQRGNATSKFSEKQILSQWFPETSKINQNNPFCNNANAAIRRSLWLNHPYDENITALEDVAWASWAIKQGYSIAYVAEAVVIHVHQETPKQVYNRYRREAMAFKYLFPEAKFTLGDFIFFFWTNTFSDLWSAAKQHQLLKHWHSILWFRFMQFWGTYQGYRHAGPLTDELRQAFYYPKNFAVQPDSPRRDIEPIRYIEKT